MRMRKYEKVLKKMLNIKVLEEKIEIQNNTLDIIQKNINKIEEIITEKQETSYLKLRAIRDAIVTTFSFMGIIATIVAAIYTVLPWANDIPIIGNGTYSKGLDNLRLGQSFDSVVKNIGNFQTKETITYPPAIYFGEKEKPRVIGYRSIILRKDYEIIVYFKNDNSLLGYVVVSFNDRFKPTIPNGMSKSSKSRPALQNATFADFYPYNQYNTYFKNPKYPIDSLAISTSSGDNAIEKYYCKVYGTYGMGFIGVAITNSGNPLSSNYNYLFKNLNENISGGSFNNYDVIKRSPDFFINESSFENSNSPSEIMEDIAGKMEKNVDSFKINSFFVFQDLEQDIDVRSFFKELLGKEITYFVSNQKLNQLK